MNAAADGKIQKARDEAMGAERIRQRGLDQEASAVNAKSQDSFEGFEGQQADRSSSLADYFTGQEVPAPTTDAAVPATSSNITVQEVGKQKTKAKDFTNRTGEALGEVRSFGDLLGDKSRLQARNAGLIGQIGGFKRGSSEIVPYELEAANTKGNALRLFGDVMGGAGSLATTAGLSKAKTYKTTLGDYLGYQNPTEVFPSAPRYGV